MKELYTNLIDSINMRGGTLAAYKIDECYRLLEAIFTPEQAEMFIKIPFGPSLADAIAKEAGKPLDETERILEGMADLGLIVTRDKPEGRVYAAIPLVPGIFEFQLTGGGETERDYLLARLFEDYFNVLKDMPATLSSLPSVPFARVIPVEEEVKGSDIEVYPYEHLSKYIDETEHIAVAMCYCRHHAKLLGDTCDKPIENCLSFGPAGKFIADRGFGRLISKDEARAILKTAAEEGLIHISSNTTDYIDFICNCCDCHCGVIQSLKAQMRNISGASNFMVQVNEDNCTLCEVCVDRCPMDAFTMTDDFAQVNLDLCVGCGLCVSTCEYDALKMVNRPDRVTPPKTRGALMNEIVASMTGSVS
jgi:H+/Na+-translocating ferredoxin:NAD+ oxidoreductase subunit B